MTDALAESLEGLRAEYETELRLLAAAQRQLARCRSCSDERTQSMYSDSLLQHIRLLRSCNGEIRSVLDAAFQQMTQSR